MVAGFFYILLFIPLLPLRDGFCQEQDEISEKQNNLQQIKSEISTLEKEINQKSKKEKESFAVLDNYNKQNFLLNRLISSLRKEEKEKENEIQKIGKEKAELENEIKKLQENYSKYVVALYKHGKSHELTALFNAASFQQAFLRLKYLQKFSERREQDLVTLNLKRDKLAASRILLENEREKKALLVEEKRKEESTLKTKLSEREKILNSIKKDKAELKKELAAKKKAEVKIKSLIEELIMRAEEKRLEEERRLASLNSGSTLDNNENLPSFKSDIDLTTADFSSFSVLKGKLNWPVSKGKVIGKFGENRNARLNTVTINYGVDIVVSDDHNVKAVADGIVSAIDFIPGYGSVIIITHKENFRTVYSHLSEIYISEGDKVKPGNIIARVGESLQGHVLHFEIWNSRINQNPEQWLARK